MRSLGNRAKNVFYLMHCFRKELWFEAKHRREFFQITPQMEACVAESGIREGLALVNAMQLLPASLSMTTNRDFTLTSKNGSKSLLLSIHIRSTNTTATKTMPTPRLKRTIMGREVVVAITNGQLDLGPWEAIFYGEFDGKRRKRVLVKIIGE
jgi:secondary thiamine-phosphate synthase enzyme